MYQNIQSKDREIDLPHVGTQMCKFLLTINKIYLVLQTSLTEIFFFTFWHVIPFYNGFERLEGLPDGVIDLGARARRHKWKEGRLEG